MANRPSYPQPVRRRLRVFSLDPTHSRIHGSTAIVSVPWEPLRPGPSGRRIRVIDARADGSRTPGVDLDDPALLAQDGLPPDPDDPAFRQQSVYAALSALLETLDLARGRRLQWRNVWRGTSDGPAVRPLDVFPHRIEDNNAFYTPGVGLSFGSYWARDDPGPGLFPGQRIHGCLSQDIVNHEAAHAFLHEVRPMSLEPTGPDALAFHEGFADIVAILQHFRLPGLLEEQVARSGTAIWEPGPFIELAGEFGRGSGSDRAVREALAAAAGPYTDAHEPHARGAFLVAALFEAFFAAYTSRISRLLRVAGLGAAPAAAALPADLVRLVCAEARACASIVLTMAVRAVDYLPPVDITFADFLDAVVAADSDLYPEDRDGFRRSFVESCRRRGIFPSTVPRRTAGPSFEVAGLDPLPTQQALLMATRDLGPYGPQAAVRRGGGQLDRSWRGALLKWGRSQAASLGFDSGALHVDGGNAGFRLDQDGFPTAIVSARLIQRNGDPPSAWAGAPLLGGVTVVAAADGRILHVVRKPVPGVGSDGEAALEGLIEHDGASAAAFTCTSAP